MYLHYTLKYLSTISSKQLPLRWFSNNDVCVCLKLLLLSRFSLVRLHATP